MILTTIRLKSKDFAGGNVNCEKPHSVYEFSSLYMDAGNMNWQKEPMLRTQHLHGSMIQHKGRLIIIGGNGDWQNQDG